MTYPSTQFHVERDDKQPVVDPAFAHDPDRNPNWLVSMKRRVYRCTECGHEHVTTTNHTGSCYPACQRCNTWIPNKRSPYGGVAIRKNTKHIYVGDAE